MNRSIASKEYSLKSTKDLIKRTIVDFNEEEILLSLYMKLPKEVKFISNRLEKIILLAKINEKSFNNNYESIINSIKKEIIENNLYNEYYLFTYIVYSKLSDLGNVSIPTLYLSVVAEIFNQLAPENMFIWGLNQDGLPIYKKEPYQDLTEFMNKLKDKKLKKKDIHKLMNKYSIANNLHDTTTYLVEMDRVYRNTISILSGLVNEEDFDIYPDEDKLDLLNISPNIREWRDTSYYLEILKERKYSLPKEGVKCVFDNISPIKEIYFKEKLFSDGIALVFKITLTDGKESSGAFIPHLDFYLDICKIRSLLSKKSYKNFILEVYSILTTDVDLNYKKMRTICVVDDIKNPSGYYLQQPLMQILKRKVEKIQISRTRVKSKVLFEGYRKEDFTPINVLVASYIRKLPVGYNASENAKEMAKKFGYILKDDETFVSPFKKKVRKKKDRKE